jgi:hypothetical protein
MSRAVALGTAPDAGRYYSPEGTRSAIRRKMVLGRCKLPADTQTRQQDDEINLEAATQARSSINAIAGLQRDARRHR